MIYKVTVDIGIDHWLTVHGMNICHERITHVIAKVIDDIHAQVKSNTIGKYWVFVLYMYIYTCINDYFPDAKVI